MPETFSSVQVCREARVSYRQLDYWVRNHWVREENEAVRFGSGTQRRFTGEQMIRASQIAALARCYVPPGVAARMLDRPAELLALRTTIDGVLAMLAAEAAYDERSRPDGRLSATTTG